MNQKKTTNITQLSKDSGIPKTQIKYLFHLIITELKKGVKVRIVNFGVFTVKNRNKHKSRNPKTGDKIIIGKHRYPHFKFNNFIKDMFKKKKK